MSNKGTDIQVMKRGVKRLLIALPLLFLGPYLLTLSFLNQGEIKFSFFLLMFIAGAAVCILAVAFAFKGINTIMEAIFGKKKK